MNTAALFDPEYNFPLSISCEMSVSFFLLSYKLLLDSTCFSKKKKKEEKERFWVTHIRDSPLLQAETEDKKKRRNVLPSWNKDVILGFPV